MQGKLPAPADCWLGGKGGGGSGLPDSQFSNKARNPDFPVKIWFLNSGNKFWTVLKHGVRLPKHFSWPHLAYRLPVVEVDPQRSGNTQKNPTVPATDLQRTHLQRCQTNACSLLCSRCLALIQVTYSDRDRAVPITHLKKVLRDNLLYVFPGRLWFR